VVLVTSNVRYLASAPEVRWRARAGALARAGAEAPASACSHNHVLLEGGEEGREVEGGGSGGVEEGGQVHSEGKAPQSAHLAAVVRRREALGEG
jgi:IS5 family transposase